MINKNREGRKYAKYIKDIDVNNITMETIPGTGGSYFDYDEEGTKELVNRVFYGIDNQQQADENEQDNEIEQQQENDNEPQRTLYHNQ